MSVGLCMNNFIPDIDEEINPHTITLDINTNKMLSEMHLSKTITHLLVCIFIRMFEGFSL